MTTSQLHLLTVCLLFVLETSASFKTFQAQRKLMTRQDLQDTQVFVDTQDIQDTRDPVDIQDLRDMQDRQDRVVTQKHGGTDSHPVPVPDLATQDRNISHYGVIKTSDDPRFQEESTLPKPKHGSLVNKTDSLNKFSSHTYKNGDIKMSGQMTLMSSTNKKHVTFPISTPKHPVTMTTNHSMKDSPEVKGTIKSSLNTKFESHDGPVDGEHLRLRNESMVDNSEIQDKRQVMKSGKSIVSRDTLENMTTNNNKINRKLLTADNSSPPDYSSATHNSSPAANSSPTDNSSPTNYSSLTNDFKNKNSHILGTGNKTSPETVFRVASRDKPDVSGNKVKPFNKTTGNLTSLISIDKLLSSTWITRSTLVDTTPSKSSTTMSNALDPMSALTSGRNADTKFSGKRKKDNKVWLRKKTRHHENNLSSSLQNAPANDSSQVLNNSVESYSTLVENFNTKIVEQKTPGQDGKISVMTDEDCPTCRKSGLTEEDVKQMRLAMFKTLLQQKLGSHHDDMEGAQSDGRMAAPLFRLPPHLVEQTIKDNSRESEKDEFYAKDEEIIIAGEEEGKQLVGSGGSGYFSFSLRGKVKWQAVSAQLWFYKTRDRNDVKGQTIRVFQPEPVKSNHFEQGEVMTTTGVNEGWVTVNVTGMLLEWLERREDKVVLGIECTTCDNYKSVLAQETGNQPLLVVRYDTTSHVMRNKRSQSCDPRLECCKRELIVNFNEINMPEVYEPHNLSIGYCYGECTEPQHFTYNHTAVKQRIRGTHTYSSQPTMHQQLKSCCVPKHLKDAFLITIENGAYIRKIVTKLIVDSCGCM